MLILYIVFSMKLYLGSAVRVANALIEVRSVVLPDGCMSSRTWVSHERLPERCTAPISSIFLEHNMVSGVVSVLRRAHVTSRQATCVSLLHCGGGRRIRTEITYYMRHSGWIWGAHFMVRMLRLAACAAEREIVSAMLSASRCDHVPLI